MTTTIDPAAEVQTEAAFPLPTPARFAVLRTGGNGDDTSTVWYNGRGDQVRTYNYDEAHRVANDAEQTYRERGFHYVVVSLNEAVQAYLDQQNLAAQPEQVDSPFPLPITASWAILRTHANEAPYWVDRLDGAGKDVRAEQDIRDRAAGLTRDHARAGYTYEPVNLNVLLQAWRGQVRMSTDQSAEVEALRVQLAQAQEDRDNARAQRDANLVTARRNVETVQAVLQEMAGEEPIWDNDAYHDFVERVNERVSWPFDRIEQDYTVTSRVTVNVSIPVYVRTTVTASDEEAATRMVQDDPSSYIDHSDVECELSREVRDAWDGDWDLDEVTDVEEQ